MIGGRGVMVVVNNLNLAEIAEQMSVQLTHDEMFAFVRYLDESVADWDFTSKLMDHYGSDELRAKRRREHDGQDHERDPLDLMQK